MPFRDTAIIDSSELLLNVKISIHSPRPESKDYALEYSSQHWFDPTNA